MAKRTNLILILLTFLLFISPFATSAEYVGEIVELQSDDYSAEIEQLKEAGAVVLRQRDELVLCLIPVSISAEKPSSLSQKRRLPGNKKKEEASRRFNTLTLNEAHKWYDASTIRQGISGTPYDGTGVVVGFSDIGFDAGHIAFRTPEGRLRVAKTVQYIESEGKRVVNDTPEGINEWLTDRNTHYHATHVAGILAGSYWADGLGGAAPGAEIVATMSELTDVGILSGVEDVIEYAKAVGKPCVVNLSIGNYLGPHDGTSLFCRYLDKCGDDAIICISSGNEGASLNTFSIDFTEGKRDMRFKLTSRVGVNLELFGAVDVWMADEKPLSFSPIIIDSSSRDAVVYQVPAIDFNIYSRVLLTSERDVDPATADNFRVIHDDEFAKYFSGNIYLTGEKNPYNGRFNLYIEYDIATDIKADGKPWGRYLLGGVVEGEQGSHADIYSDGVYSAFSKFYGADDLPGSINSISDLATGHNVICVGMYNNHEELKYPAGGSWPSCVPGMISSYSGYGTLIDGRVLPHTSGPGFPIVSAFSSPYLANPDNAYRRSMMVLATKGDYHPTDIILSAETAEEYNPDYYYWGPEGGTSMSTPYVAGYIATWLQANPDLKVADIQGILAKTNDRSGQCEYGVDPRNGHGFFRPVEGLKEAMAISTSIDISEHKSVSITQAGALLYITLPEPDTTKTQLDIYDINGKKVKSSELSATFNAISIDSLIPGLYIITISGHTPAKIFIR